MPKELEEKLRQQATQQGLKGKAADAYVYGTLRKTGWTPGREREGESGRPAGEKGTLRPRIRNGRRRQ